MKYQESKTKRKKRKPKKKQTVSVGTNTSTDQHAKRNLATESQREHLVRQLSYHNLNFLILKTKLYLMFLFLGFAHNI